MKRSTSTMLAAATLLGFTAIRADAQTSGPVRNPFGTGELPEFLKPYDLNNDGKLSIEERIAYEKACREARPPRPGIKNPWDTDGDGTLSDAEKQAARDAIALKIEEERTRRFNQLDVDGNLFLTALELQAIPRITAEQITAMIGHLDKDADGQISKEEFLAAMAPVQLPPMPPPPLGPVPCPHILRPLDTNRNGVLTPEEFAALDTNQDGKVVFEEWKAYLFAHPELLPTPPPLPPHLAAFDANKDGVLQPVEHAAFVTAVDTNGDRMVSRQELDAYLLAHPELKPPSAP